MKRVLAALLCLLLVVSLTACGDEKNSHTSSAPSSSVPSSSTPSSSEDSSSELDSSVVGPTSSGGAQRPSDQEIIPVQPPEKPELSSSYRAYDVLTELQQEYYNNMLAGIEDMQTGWIVLGETGENFQADVAVARSAVIADHPEIFWLPSFYATAEATSSTGVKNAVIYFSVDAESPPSYLYTVQQKEKMAAELDKTVKDMVSKVIATAPYDVELQLHDLICAESEYNDDATDPAIYTAYGALVNKKALCEGYSRAMQLLLEECGIPATVVTGVADGEDHMWNSVFLQGEWYNVDVTWDDMVGETSHEYFNLSDEMVSHDHVFHPDAHELTEEVLATGLAAFNLNRPVAEGTEYNYFNRSGFVLFADGASALAAYLTRTEGTFVEVRFSDKKFRDRVFEASDEFIARINEALSTWHTDCGFRVGGYSVSSMVLRLYKKQV